MDFLHTTSQSDLGVFALGLIIAGAVSGVATGVLGIGGGVVIVPVLYHVMVALGIGADERMHVAVGTSLAAIIPAALTQNSRAEIDWPCVRIEAAPLIAGVAVGSAGATIASGSALALVFAVVALPVVVYLVFVQPHGAAAKSPGDVVLPAIAGLASGLTGIAADTIRRSICGLWKTETKRNRATTSLLAILSAGVGTLIYGIAGWRAHDLPPYSLGYVNLIGFALIAPVLVAAEPAGASLAPMMDLRRLRLVFAGLIVIVTARMLWDAFA